MTDIMSLVCNKSSDTASTVRGLRTTPADTAATSMIRKLIDLNFFIEVQNFNYNGLNMALEECGLDDVQEGDIALWTCQVALPIVPSPIIDVEMVQVAIRSIVLLLHSSLRVSRVGVAHLIQHVIVLRILFMVARFKI